MCSYSQLETSKSRLEAVLRVDNFNSKNSDAGIKSIDSEKGRNKIYYNSISVIKPLKSSQHEILGRITNSDIPYLTKEAHIEYKETTLNSSQVKKYEYTKDCLQDFY